MADILPRPPYDTSSETASGRSPSEIANAEWVRGKVSLEFLLTTSPNDPTPSTIPQDTVRIVKNTATGRVSIWVNSGGQIIDLLSFEV